MKKKSNITAGSYYGVTQAGKMVELPGEPGVPDAVICRRVADFGFGQIPGGAAFGTCGKCGADVVYNPAGRHLDRPRRCMQCASIRPLPIERT